MKHLTKCPEPSSHFAEPIRLPDGTQLKTLRDAISYLARTVPKFERDMLAVTTAAKTLAEFDFRYNNRIAQGVDDKDRATELAKGIVGKRLTYRRPNPKDIPF